MKEKENDELDIQLKVFDENKEDDLTELSHRLNDIRAEMEYPFDKPEKSFCMYCEKGFVSDFVNHYCNSCLPARFISIYLY